MLSFLKKCKIPVIFSKDFSKNADTTCNTICIVLHGKRKTDPETSSG